MRAYHQIAFLKIKNSQVLAYNFLGRFIKLIGHYGAIATTITNDAIVITYSNGRSMLYDYSGMFRKYL